MRHFAIEKDGVKAGNVMPVAQELGITNLMFHPDDLKQPDEKAEPKTPVDEPDPEINLQIEYLQRQHDEYALAQFESSEDAEIKFNDKLAKELNITEYGSGKYLNQYKSDDPMFFIPRKESDASGAKQLLSSIADDGETAEEQLEKDT